MATGGRVRDAAIAPPIIAKRGASSTGSDPSGATDGRSTKNASRGSDRRRGMHRFEDWATGALDASVDGTLGGRDAAVQMGPRFARRLPRPGPQ